MTPSWGLGEKGLSRSVERAAREIHRAFGHAPKVMIERVMLLAASLEHEIGRFLDDADRALEERASRGLSLERWRCPIASIDLLVLVLAWFYERDRAKNFWHLPALVRDGLRPSMLRLGEAIDRVIAEAGD
jgi:hypothetical protein